MLRIVVYALAALAAGSLGGTQAAPITFTASLSGDAENPPIVSPGTGSATVIFDPDAHSMSVNVSFDNLTGMTTVAHIHGPVTEPGGTAGVATQVPSFVDFPANVTSGSYTRDFDTLDPATYNPAFVTANGGSVEEAEAAFFAMLLAGSAYLNIHTVNFPAGEIRGFLIAQTVAAPPAGFILAAGALLLTGMRRRA